LVIFFECPCLKSLNALSNLMSGKDGLGSKSIPSSYAIPDNSAFRETFMAGLGNGLDSNITQLSDVPDDYAKVLRRIKSPPLPYTGAGGLVFS